MYSVSQALMLTFTFLHCRFLTQHSKVVVTPERLHNFFNPPKVSLPDVDASLRKTRVSFEATVDKSRVQTQAVLPRVRSEERSEEACLEEWSEEGLSSARLNGVVLSSSDLNSTNLLLAFSRSNVLTRPTGQRKMPVWTRQRSVLRVSMTLWPGL